MAEYITVKCESNISKQCYNTFNMDNISSQKNRSRNNGKLVCFQCKRHTTHLGDKNGNKKYHFDQRFFQNIDSELKAYFLGFIASDGNINKSGFNIYINKRDVAILQELKDSICNKIILTSKKDNLLGFNINSVLIRDDICKHLSISPGKKSEIVSMPTNISNDLKIHFIRGYFDGDGSINTIKTPTKGWPLPKCSIASNSHIIRKQIEEFIDIPCWNNNKDKLEWWSNNALDFLGKIYDKSQIRMTRKYELYLDWSMWVPALRSPGGKRGLFKFAKTDKNAIPPSKQRASDSGYDLTLIKKIKETDLLVWYDTCIKVQPAYGWYFDVVLRSSGPKTGHILANALGIIDRTYTGTIQACFFKLNKDVPDLKLPSRILQIIPRPIINIELVEGIIDKTNRSDGGFGSSG